MCRIPRTQLKSCAVGAAVLLSTATLTVGLLGTLGIMLSDWDELEFFITHHDLGDLDGLGDRETIIADALSLYVLVATMGAFATFVSMWYAREADRAAGSAKSAGSAGSVGGTGS